MGCGSRLRSPPNGHSYILLYLMELRQYKYTAELGLGKIDEFYKDKEKEGNLGLSTFSSSLSHLPFLVVIIFEILCEEIHMLHPGSKNLLSI